MSFLVRGVIAIAALGAILPAACPQKSGSDPVTRAQRPAIGPLPAPVPCPDCYVNSTTQKLLGTLGDPDGTHASWFPLKSMHAIVCDKADCTLIAVLGTADIGDGKVGTSVSGPYSGVSATDAWIFWVDQTGAHGCLKVTVSP